MNLTQDQRDQLTKGCEDIDDIDDHEQLVTHEATAGDLQVFYQFESENKDSSEKVIVRIKQSPR